MTAYMNETWKSVVGHAGYEVSDLGRVKSSLRGGRILRPGIASNGYPTVALGRGKTRTIHSLVAEAFIGPRPDGQEVRHKDGNRRNPAALNLSYGTRTQNIYDAVAHGTWLSPARLKHCKQLRSYRHDA
jgi:hypothetical protein